MIPRFVIDNFTEGINAISVSSQKALADALSTIDLAGNVADVREQVVAIMDEVCRASTESVSMLSGQFYNACREIELGAPIDFDPNSGRNPAATDGAVRAFAEKLVEGKQQEFVDACLQRVDYENKVAAAQTCLNASKRDPRKPKFARVPDGFETCDFCLMLASRGFVYRNEVTAKHSHSNCNCRIVPSWGDDSVEGYDTDEIYDRWQQSIDEIAERRSERKGTTFEAEREKIMEGYKRAASNAKKRNGA